MRLGAFPQGRDRIRQNRAHLTQCVCSGYRNCAHNINVSDRTQSQDRQSTVRRPNRYPSPSIWSGPLWVRPTFPTSHKGLGVGRPIAGFACDGPRRIAKQCGICQGSPAGRLQEGQRACGSRFLRHWVSHRLYWRHVATHLRNNRCWGPVPGQAQRPFLTAMLPSARWLVRRAMLPIATSTRNAADRLTPHSSGLPGAIEHTVLADRRGGVFVMSVSLRRGSRTKRDTLCSRKS